MKEEEKVGAARQLTAVLLPHFKDCRNFLQPKARAAQANGERLGTRIVPQFPVAVRPSSIHTSSLYPASTDTKAVAGEDAIRITKKGSKRCSPTPFSPFLPHLLAPANTKPGYTSAAQLITSLCPAA